MGRDSLPTDLVRLLEHLPHEGEPGFHRLADAAHALDVHVADAVRQVVLSQQLADLVHLAPETEHDDVREVRMPRVARKRATQELKPFAGRHPAAGLVRQRNHAINIGEFRQRLIACERVALERIGDEAGRVGAAVHRRQDADVVAGRDAPVRTNDPLERSRLGNVVGRLCIHAIGVVLREVAHAHVVDMHMLPWSNGLGREADDLIVLSDRLTLLDPADSYLVPRGDALGRDDPLPDWRARKQGRAGDDHAVSFMKTDNRVDDRQIGPLHYGLLFRQSFLRYYCLFLSNERHISYNLCGSIYQIYAQCMST